MKFYFSAIFLFFITFISTTYAQQGNITIAGKVIDADDKLSVSYANIGIPKKGLGTVTNANGEFVFILPSSTLSDSLRITCIGYNAKTVVISALTPAGSVSITLTKSTTQLKQVSIESAAEADHLFSMLMGDEVAPRREFIEKNAKYARIDV